VSDIDVVKQLAGARPIVDLPHARHRTEGVIGVLWRDGAAIAICAHRCELTALPGAIGSQRACARSSRAPQPIETSVARY